VYAVVLENTRLRSVPTSIRVAGLLLFRLPAAIKGLGSSTIRVGAVRIKTTAKSIYLGKDKGLSRTVSESEDNP
jgi:hypothetical protein